MPIYEYECDRCGHHLEALQKISEEPLVYCPECGEAALRKKVSAAAFRLKGTGWYETDFKNAEKTKKAEAGKEKNDNNAGKQTDKDTVSPSGNSKDVTSSDTQKTSSKSEGKSADTSSSSEAKGGSSKSSSGTSPSNE